MVLGGAALNNRPLPGWLGKGLSEGSMTVGSKEVVAAVASGAANRVPRPTVHWTADGHADVLRLFEQGTLVHVAAPMVRYSKYAPGARLDAEVRFR